MSVGARYVDAVFQAYSMAGNEMQEQALFWSMMFLVLGVADGLGFFISVS